MFILLDIKTYPNLPEIEDVTMQLASLSGIVTVPDSLLRLSSGKLAYISKRMTEPKKARFT